MLTLGTRIGPYEVTGQIGVGGMGEVYRATDTDLGRQVAIKVLPDAVAIDAERLARFDREARTLAALNHPNIATIYGVARSGGTTALVMELVEGPTLADRIIERPIPIDEAMVIARQVADALEAAHEQGIVHRDLKPANVKLRPDRTVKVLDFGLAKTVDRAAAMSPGVSMSPTITTPAMTQAGIILGTAAYMSPEQVRGKSVDRRSDVWAFGCVLYEMLTGVRPFSGDEVSDTLAAVLRAEPDWSLLPSDVPPSIRRLLRRCLQKDRRERLADVADARLEIADALAPSGDERASDAASSPTPRQERIVWRWALVAAIVLAAGVVAWGLRTPRAETQQVIRSQLAPGAEIATGIMPQISPDGRLVAFVGYGTDNVWRVFVRALDQTDEKPLAGTEWPYGAIFWSPDSRQLAFPAAGKLKKIDVAGGLPQSLCDLGPSSIVVGGSWNRDGAIIFGDAAGGIQRASAGGGTCQALTTPEPNESNHLFPFFLPDGKHFLYLSSTREPDYTTDLYVGSLDAAPDRQKLKKLLKTNHTTLYVPSSGSGPGRLLFVRDATLFAQAFDPERLELAGEPAPIAANIGTLYNNAYFSSSTTGILVYRTSDSNEQQLTWFDRQGRSVVVPGDPLFARTLAVSRDGRRAAFESFADGGLITVDLERGTRTRLGTSNGLGIAWSPDGRRVLFSQNEHLYRSAEDGTSDADSLFTSAEFKYPSDWSSDGRFVLYRMDSSKTKSDLWALPLEGNGKPFLLVQTPFNEVEPRLSSDGRWIAYISDESGRQRSMSVPSCRPPEGRLLSEVESRRFPPEASMSSWAGARTARSCGISHPT